MDWDDLYPSRSDLDCWRSWSDLLDAPHAGIIVRGPARRGDWDLGRSAQTQTLAWIARPDCDTVKAARVACRDDVLATSYAPDWRL